MLLNLDLNSKKPLFISSSIFADNSRSLQTSFGSMVRDESATNGPPEPALIDL